MHLLRPDPIHPIRKRLGQAAGALALIVMVLVTREAILRNTSGTHRLSFGPDFLPVYAAGRLVHEGRASELYAMEPLAAIERQVVGEADLRPLQAYGPFLNPPFFAAAYVPFAKMPYRAALSVWVALNVLLLIGSMVLLCRLLPRGQPWPVLAMASLLVVLPLPFWEAVWYQQNTFLSLFLTCAIVSLWRRPIALAGSVRTVDPPNRGSRSSKFLPDPCAMLCGVLFYKPQLALVIALALILTRGLRAVVGLALTGSILLMFTLREMPGTLWSFIHTLPPTVDWLRNDLHYNWGQQLTPQSFWRLLLQAHGPGPTAWVPRALGIATGVGFGIALATAGYRTIRRGNVASSPWHGRPRPWTECAESRLSALGRIRLGYLVFHSERGVGIEVQSHTGGAPVPLKKAWHLDRFITAAICTMPLLMPYYMDYDLLLLAVPATLFAGEWIRSPRAITRADRFLFAAWIALFLETYVNGGLGAHYGLNLAVPLIGVVAGLSIWRCLRPQVATVPVEGYDAPPLAAAAA